jgi:hypothetical protein
MTVGRGTEASMGAPARAQRHASLSVCCMTSGQRPRLLAGVLAPLREVAAEIVVAVEEPQAAEAAAALGGIADRVLAFPPTAPSDRPIAWLFRECGERWIFNIDDDEVPSPALVAALPRLAERTDITHAWIARRWLYPSPETAIASAPWCAEFQLRFALADERFTQFSDVFHRPVVCHGPSAYVLEPLWHLDTVLNPAERRRRKAAYYERERAGMRIGGIAHNLGLYVPELHEPLELAPVPPEDRVAIEAALAARGGASAPVEVSTVQAEDVDREWVGAPFDAASWRGEVVFAAPPSSLVAGVQATVDVLVANHGDRTWRWGEQAAPAVVLEYAWSRDGQEAHDLFALRTSLPVDVPPGATEPVPVHVVPPGEPGEWELQVGLRHGRLGRFGDRAVHRLEVRPRARVAVVSRPERLHELVAELGLPPSVEPFALLRDAADREHYGDYDAVVGPRPYLLASTATSGRLRTLVSLARRTLALTRPQRHAWSRPGYAELLAARSSSDALVVDSPNWADEDAFGREWGWVAAALLLWRLEGKPAVVREEALPGGDGVRERAVRLVLRALSRA